MIKRVTAVLKPRKLHEDILGQGYYQVCIARGCDLDRAAIEIEKELMKYGPDNAYMMLCMPANEVFQYVGTTTEEDSGAMGMMKRELTSAYVMYAYNLGRIAKVKNKSDKPKCLEGIV